MKTIVDKNRALSGALRDLIELTENIGRLQLTYGMDSVHADNFMKTWHTIHNRAHTALRGTE